ncbi:MAG: MFS transporter [Deltaproteobacteria bacterium]|jgi:EmrB/QacA subfamily drug resistance transporter|nr:MFS transporter [Deltaproteobacteria bacterium]
MANTDDSLKARASSVLPWIVGVSFFMQAIDGSVLNNAIPSMAVALNVNPLKMKSVVIAYLLTTALFIPVSGWLADRFGIRRVFSLAIVVFSLGSLACALSETLKTLVASRVLQGIGGALMVPVGRLAVVKAYDRGDLIRVLSFVSVPSLLGPVCGPLAGGFFVEYASWHWIFLINLPVGAFGFWLSLKHMPDLREENLASFDFLGFVVFGASVAILSLGLESAPSHAWDRNVFTLVFGVGFMSVYWLRLAKRRGALFQASIFETPGFLTGICSNFCSRVGSGAMPFMLPIFLQLALGFSPVRAGLFMLPQAIGSIVGKRFITTLLPKAGFRRFLLVNTIALGLIICSFSLLGTQTAHWRLALIFMFYGAINSMQFTALNSLILIDLGHKKAGPGNSLLSVVIQVCSNSGVAMGAALLGMFALLDQGGTFRVDLPTDAIFQKSFFVIGLVILTASLVIRRLPKDEGERDIQPWVAH